MTSIKETECPLLQKGVKRIGKTNFRDSNVSDRKDESWRDHVLIWPSNENYGTNCDNLDMLIKEISETAEEVGLDSVDPVSITEVLQRHSQPLSNEELYDFAQQLTEQQKEDEDEEDHGTKAMQMKALLIFFLL